MEDCGFCDIVSGRSSVAVLFETVDFIAFADRNPIRPGHVQLVPRAHVETFDELTSGLAASLMTAAQETARAQKRLYGVDRVGLVMTGGDIAHCHAHLVPIRLKTDITSLRYYDVVELPRTARARPDLSSLEREMARLRPLLEVSNGRGNTHD